ncbi:MAG: hypothetical protein ACRDJN_15710 [Chloroflexota bacterium]
MPTTMPMSTDSRPIKVCWVADDDEEASYAGSARLPDGPPLVVEWHRIPPAVADLAGYDLLVVDPGALRIAPDELERRVHDDLPSLPIVFFSGLAQQHHLRAGPGLRWALPSLVHWIAHGEYTLSDGLPRRLAAIASESATR